jgi:hypothetical protein
VFLAKTLTFYSFFFAFFASLREFRALNFQYWLAYRSGENLQQLSDRIATSRYEQTPGKFTLAEVLKPQRTSCSCLLLHQAPLRPSRLCEKYIPHVHTMRNLTETVRKSLIYNTCFACYVIFPGRVNDRLFLIVSIDSDTALVKEH